MSNSPSNIKYWYGRRQNLDLIGHCKIGTNKTCYYHYARSLSLSITKKLQKNVMFCR